MAEFHLVESASALYCGLEVEDEEDGEVRHGGCLLVRLGTNEGGAAEDLPLPEDAPTRRRVVALEDDRAHTCRRECR